MKNSIARLAVMIALSFTLAGVCSARANHLAGQKSAYLTRAAGQPVDWYPWGAAAFQRAKELDRPILLDVGAIWCPWCALMDKETYTNAETADYINQHFVAVKVDYDAAPELVKQLQKAQALLNLPAGLPLTSFMTPEGKLYAGAGYLPSAATSEKQSFKQAAEDALKEYGNKKQIEAESFQLEVAK